MMRSNDVASSICQSLRAGKEKVLALDEDHFDTLMHTGEDLKSWDERISVISWRGKDTPFVPAMPFGADRIEGTACQAGAYTRPLFIST